jgi:hypothetical protein
MNHAYVVAGSSAGSHGMQVFDLTRLRTGGYIIREVVR